MMKISVITPVYNRADCILRCLDSVTTQQCDTCEIEHVVVDDGSTDRTYELISDYAGSHGHVKVVKFDSNRGTNAGRNAAIKAATGDFVIILDSDDMMMPGAIATVADHIARYPQYEYFMFGCDDRADDVARFGKERLFGFDDFLLEEVEGDFVHVMRRDVPLTLPFDEEVRVCESVFFLRFYKRVQTMAFFNITIYNRDRQRPDHVTKTLRKVSDEAFVASIRSLQLLCTWFNSDYYKTQKGRQILIGHLQEVYKLSTLMEDERSVEWATAELRKLGIKLPVVYKVVHATGCGHVARVVGKNIVKLKHFLNLGRV